MKKFRQWLTVILATVFFISSLGTTLVQAADNNVPPANDQYLQKVKDKGTLVMGTSPDFPPYEFMAHGKSKIVGMDVAIAQKIAQDLGVKLVVKSMDFDSLLVALQTGKIDMAMAGMSKTAKRAQSVDFSDVYFHGGMYMVIHEGDKGKYKTYKDLAGQGVGAQTGSIQYNLVKNQAKKSTLKGMDKITDLILALQTHKVAAVVLDQASAEAYANNTNGLTAVDAKFKIKVPGTAIAFPKGAQSLVNAANQSITEIKAKNLINKKYLPEAGKYMTTGSFKANKNKKAAAKSSNSMWAYKDFFIAGLGYTIFISAISVFFGFLLGIILALMRLSHSKVAIGIATAYIEFVRGTPLMVQLLFVYFGLGLVVNIPALLSGIIAVSLNSAAYVAEVIRSGINSIPVGQTEASRSLGMSRSMTMKYIILPQAMKNIWPALGNEFVSLIKESSIVSVIGVKDLIYQSKIVQADTYRGVMPLVITMILYFIITFGISRLMKYFEGKMSHE
ncbi:ABC transporter permease [Bombilactobacillus bombi]|uniref:ABC transporter permease n=1 Tax=Bombilactobacillus bombi TaxID=1303590 RepID=A0A3R6YN13_9LACO|nr:ABC transporter substrate-binding protein/permease [Bombilactobacillus bombi]MCO6541051.1 ABC transporter substrate-binding protein/permease [Lactobacillus sp.]RHW51266.1 ABC transporter permease [Bombilactobacillus bombi]